MKEDKGLFETEFIGGRGLKTGLRAEAVGCVDELTACLLFALSYADASSPSALQIKSRCEELILVGTDLSYTVKPKSFTLTEAIYEAFLCETRMLEATLPPLNGFILPDGGKYPAALNLARTCARRAERAALRLMEEDRELNPLCGRYLNLLSTYLFAEMRKNLV